MTSYLRSTIRLLALTSCFLVAYVHSQAQIGFQVSSFIPKGDIGQYFNKGTSIDAYFVIQSDDGKWQYRVGCLYTALSSRIDTVPIYGVREGGGMPTMVLPGFLVNRNFSIKCISGEISRRIFDIHGLGLYGGAGFIGGISHVDYVKEIKTVITETSSIDTKIAGVKLNALLQYRINDHFDVFFDASRSLVTSGGNDATSYTHNKFGIGANYFIFQRERE